MKINVKFLFILLFLFFISVSFASANDLNSTDSIQTDSNDAFLTGEDSNINNNEILSDYDVNGTLEKTTPKITLKSTNVKSDDDIVVYFRNSSGNPIENAKLNAFIGNKKYSIQTDSKGVAKLPIYLAAKNYKITVNYDGNESYNPVSKQFTIKVSKLNTLIMPLSNFVVKGGYLNFYLYDQNWKGLGHKKITIYLNGKTYIRTTDKNGLTKVRIGLSKSKYLIKTRFRGDNYYKSSLNKLAVHVTSPLSIKIENSKLLTHGYLRVYLKNSKGAIKTKATLQIANKKMTKRSSSDGFVVFKPDVASKTYKVTVKIGKYWTSKKLDCYDGNVKNPLKEVIPLKNGRPDIDLMPGNYVTGDENGKYTLTKAQYREVLKRDSHCLFLNNKLTKYTFFKTKNHPNTNHIIKREKWNVIEREINKKIVSANKNGYWPSQITVSLKGKSYTYPEVKDNQNTAYTCGPASCSVCSQALKNYVCESYLAKLAGSKRGEGTKCSGMISALEKNNFKCSYFYKNSFNDALKELKNGGCALVFHADKHYVSIIDVSSDGRKVLVSNSYGSYDNIPTKWLSVNYMKSKFSHWEESLIVRLNYRLPDSTRDSINAYYQSMGTNWAKHNTHQGIGLI